MADLNKNEFGNLGPRDALEEFALAHELPARWVSSRHDCETLVRDPQFWYRPDMQNAARMLATEASAILHARLRGCGEGNVHAMKPAIVSAVRMRRSIRIRKTVQAVTRMFRTGGAQ
jgi:hypothetical protein